MRALYDLFDYNCIYTTEGGMGQCYETICITLITHHFIVKREATNVYRINIQPKFTEYGLDRGPLVHHAEYSIENRLN